MAFDKVVDSAILDTELKNLADILREKSDTAEELDFYAGDFLQTAESIETGADARAEINTLIDESGVLGSTEGMVTEKVKQLIHATDLFFKLYEVNFYGIHSVERIEFYIDWVKGVNFQYARGLKYLKGIDISKLISARGLFMACNLLETIEMPFDMSTKVAYHIEHMFLDCSSLVNVGFVAETIIGSISFAASLLLSAESIQSIIDGLATVSAAQTLTFNPSIVLTDEQKATINSKGWTLVQ